MSSVTIELWQANLGRGVSVAEFTRNLRRVLDAGGDDAVFCFQEIDEADLPREMDILKGLVADTHRVYGDKTTVPILVPKGMGSGNHEVTPAADGLAHYTPMRVVNEVQLRLPLLFAPRVLNTHLPILRPPTLSRRRDVRNTLRYRCHVRRSQGGVWVADTNTHVGWPTIVKGERVVTNAGIDKAKAWPTTGGRVVVTHRRTVNLTIDGHDAHGARITWSN